MNRYRLIGIVAGVAAIACGLTVAWSLRSPATIKVGLITKTTTNPFFVKMEEGARSSALSHQVELLTAAGRFDNDNETQSHALQSMVDQGARAILITPGDAKAIVPAIESARAKGVLVIALDSPTDPVDAVDAFFGTDNIEAGRLIGRYGRAAMGQVPPRIATLDLFPGHPVGIQRHNGFLDGMGLASAGENDKELARPPEVVCMKDTNGDREMARAAMAACLGEHPDINIVYTINEPAAAGARAALDAAGGHNVPILSIDGGCDGIQAVAKEDILATAQQYPMAMAIEGVAAGAAYARTGTRPNRRLDTGVVLVTNHPQRGIDSRNTVYGKSSCWG